MKNYKSIRNFQEAMQKPPQDAQQHRQRNRMPNEKPEPEFSFKKVIEFLKGMKP